MNPEPTIDPNLTDEDYEVEIIDADAKPVVTDGEETTNIEREGDPIGGNFA